MTTEEIDYSITRGRTTISNCFAVDGLIYFCVPEHDDVAWVSEHDEEILTEMQRRLDELGQAYRTKSELMAALQHHSALQGHVDLISRYE